LTFGLIQAVRKKTADSHVALRGNISALVRVTDLVEASKDTASLVVCTRKKFFWLGGAGFLLGGAATKLRYLQTSAFHRQSLVLFG